MKRLLISVLFMASAAGQLGAQVMPSWLTAYPGATPENNRTDTAVSSSYTVAAMPKDVVAHFQKIFDAQGIPIDSIGAPEGFYLHAEPAECNVDISIVRGDKDTAVKVICKSKAGVVQQIIMQPVEDQSDQQPGKDAARPGAKPGLLVWPDWLVRVDGGKPAVRKVGNQFKGTFTADPPRHDIEVFYMDLLNGHGFAVSENLPSGLDDYGNWLEGTSDPNPKTKRSTVIQIRMKPAGQKFSVEITVQ
jgi:hypothetical protein